MLDRFDDYIPGDKDDDPMRPKLNVWIRVDDESVRSSYSCGWDVISEYLFHAVSVYPVVPYNILALGVGLTCPATFNRADFYASQLAVVPGKEVESHRKIQWLCDEFDSSRYGQELVKLVTQARNERRSIIPCRKEFDDDDLQSLLEKCYISNPELLIAINMMPLGFSLQELTKSSRAAPPVLAHVAYISVDSSMTNWACGNEAKVLFSALLVNVAFPD
uniref:Uncharacterized protein n=1 Tax=Timema genevievae TaxID=629358 RepID=A0A7R9PLS2_TIMGE|nr:unnamed protein product [Timema genevievae]